MSGLKPPDGSATEQWQRVLSAVVILPPLLLFITYASQVLFLFLICLVMGLSWHEYVRLLRLQRSPVAGVCCMYATTFALALTAYFGGVRWMPLMLSLSVVALTVNAMVTTEATTSSFSALLFSLLGLLLIGWGLSHLILVRDLSTGRGYILLLFSVIWVGDTTAMYVGKGLGRHKLALTISPGKTWEGAVGGIVGALLAAALGTHFLTPQLGLPQSLIFGLLISVAAQISDLGESMLKRYVGVKDSGTLIPGHGGILDRIDSLFFAAPLAFYTLDFLTTWSVL
jgi:phosphatidate cytidylyltransferase